MINGIGSINLSLLKKRCNKELFNSIPIFKYEKEE